MFMMFNRNLIKSYQSRFSLLKFRLPDLGEKIKEATVKGWLVKEG